MECGMCGDLDEDERQIEEQLYARFRAHAQAVLAEYSNAAGRQPSDLNEYLDKLFSDTLSRSARDGDAAEPAQRYERLAMQPLVFARLAGFLAAHLSPSQEPLREVIEALKLGYSEAEEMDRDSERHQHGDVPAR
jgi:hypothetical protein